MKFVKQLEHSKSTKFLNNLHVSARTSSQWVIKKFIVYYFLPKL